MVPDHPFLQAVEPEQFSGRREVRHPAPMLSIEKAYTQDQLERFVARVQKEADALGIGPVEYRLTPKLDGLAGRDDGDIFATRGNGEVGYEISSAFAKGVVPIGGRGQGVGEIVVVKSYFEQTMAEFFEHPRNMVVGIISSDTLNENAKRALDDGMVHFYPYSQVKPSIIVDGKKLIEKRRQLVDEILSGVDYPTDGVVAEITNEELKLRMGATAHHYRWQIAIKTKGETAETTVVDIQWQVGRTGNITPVMIVEPVPLSGATIRRVTAHHAGNIRDLHIGPGTCIEIIRSGEVIPKLEAVVEARGDVQLPHACPSCGQPLSWQNDFLKCTNQHCGRRSSSASATGSGFWAMPTGSASRPSRKSWTKGTKAWKRSTADRSGFRGNGFRPVQSKNLAEAIAISRTKPVEDWRFLAAFGISNLGTGDSRKLLAHIPLEKIPAIEPEDLIDIKGFGEKTSQSIAESIRDMAGTIVHMLDQNFNLQRTPLAADQEAVDSSIAGKGIVFTGKMIHGDRQTMQARARELGARVQTAVSGSTDYLVCGEKVGASKMNKAEKLGVAILTEDQYIEMLGNR